MPASVVIYTRDDCSACDGLREFLDRHGIAYDERNTSQEPAYRDEMAADDLTELPTVIIFGIAVQGFRSDVLAEMLGI